LNFKHFNLDDATLFVKKVGKIVVYLVVYVDDMLISGNTKSYIVSTNKYLKKGLEMQYLGHLHYYFGIKVIQNPKYNIHLPKEVHWRIIEQVWHG
jgi:hypothetical protein